VVGGSDHLGLDLKLLSPGPGTRAPTRADYDVAGPHGD
jgi:hypothetical protein